MTRTVPVPAPPRDGSFSAADWRVLAGFWHPLAHAILDAAAPVAADRARIFMLVARNFEEDRPVEDAIAFQMAVNEEDRAIVESIRPRELRLDREGGPHLRADRWSMVYRRRLAAYGLGRAGARADPRSS